MSSEEPVHITATLTITPGKLEEFVKIARQMTKDVEEKEPGALAYYFFLSKNEQGQDRATFVEKYANEQASKAHTEQAHFKPFAELLDSLLVGPGDVIIGHSGAGFDHRKSVRGRCKVSLLYMNNKGDD